MHIVVIGTGFVGVVTSAVLAKLQHHVVGLDIDQHKIDLLQNGKVPFYEPELDTLIQTGLASGHLRFTTNYDQAIPTADLVIVAVGTPAKSDGSADLSAVFSTVKTLAPLLQEHAIVAIKSTVPPGTNDQLHTLLEEGTNKTVYLASLPEFLREGSAVGDTLHPDRIVIGAKETYVIDTLTQLHRPLSSNIIVVSPDSAQMAKYTANAYLALRITYINQIANLCEKNGADIQEVITAIGEDKRIGSHYWYPGLGYGGSCFPKDVKELASYAHHVGEADGILTKMNELNETRIDLKLDQFGKKIQGYRDKKVAVLGLSFKPHTTDMREAPSLKVVPYLHKAGAIVTGHDPQAIPAAKPLLPNMQFAQNPYEAAKDADVILLLVEWPELTSLDLKQLAQVAHPHAVFIDTRNQYPKAAVESTGMRYLSIGN